MEINAEKLAQEIKNKEKAPVMVNINFRAKREEFDAFKDACGVLGVSASSMLREFMVHVVQQVQNKKP